VLFLDEPFAALDAPTRQSQLQEFKAVLAESAVTAVFATHDRSEAVALDDRVAVLVNGRIAQVDSTEVVFTYPDGVDVARFVGVDTLIPGHVTGRENGLLQVECGSVRILADGSMESGDRVCVAVRPESIDLFAQDDPDIGVEHNELPGIVTKLVPTETHYRVEIDCGTRVVSVASRARVRDVGLEPGKLVKAVFSAHSAHLIRLD
jgi:tungstate transport system ATP-binding protein